MSDFLQNVRLIESAVSKMEDVGMGVGFWQLIVNDPNMPRKLQNCVDDVVLESPLHELSIDRDIGISRLCSKISATVKLGEFEMAEKKSSDCKIRLCRFCCPLTQEEALTAIGMRTFLPATARQFFSFLDKFYEYYNDFLNTRFVCMDPMISVEPRSAVEKTGRQIVLCQMGYGERPPLIFEHPLKEFPAGTWFVAVERE